MSEPDQPVKTNSTDPTAGPQSQDAPPTKPRPNLIELAHQHWKWLALVAALIIVGGSIYAWTILRPAPEPTTTTVNKMTPKPTPAPPVKKASPLTGAMVETAIADRPVMGVVVENSPEARPQSGLSQAGVVYEANAEGGITRFEAFFLDSLPATIGPVRSLRTYFVDWALEFNSPIAHAGGNIDALDQIAPLGVKSLNALAIGAPSFYRTRDRRAPHNLYTSADLLSQLVTSKGYNKPATFTPSPRKADTPNAAPPHPNVHIEYSYGGFQVDYKYDPATNDYARNLARTPHIDRVTGQQIRVKNIVVEYMPTNYGITRFGEQAVRMQTVGRGQGMVFRDGEAIPCTWIKESRTTRTKLIGADGKDIPLNAGNTWYSIVPVGKSVTY